MSIMSVTTVNIRERSANAMNATNTNIREFDIQELENLQGGRDVQWRVLHYIFDSRGLADGTVELDDINTLRIALSILRRTGYVVCNGGTNNEGAKELVYKKGGQVMSHMEFLSFLQKNFSYEQLAGY